MNANEKRVTAKELRIGNLILGASRGQVCVATSEIINAIDRGIAVYCTIPLTEEWLLKFGFDDEYWDIEPSKMYCLNYDYRPKFTYSIVTYDGINFSLRIYQPKSLDICSMEGHECDDICCEGDVIDVDVKYIHQLQNLYFALTGEELQIQEHHISKFQPEKHKRSIEYFKGDRWDDEVKNEGGNDATN